MEDERKIVVERGTKMHRQGLGHYREEVTWKEGERSRLMRKWEGGKEAHGGGREDRGGGREKDAWEKGRIPPPSRELPPSLP